MFMLLKQYSLISNPEKKKKKCPYIKIVSKDRYKAHQQKGLVS